jgi:hypothetical protein
MPGTQPTTREQLRRPVGELPDTGRMSSFCHRLGGSAQAASTSRATTAHGLISPEGDAGTSAPIVTSVSSTYTVNAPADFSQELCMAPMLRGATPVATWRMRGSSGKRPASEGLPSSSTTSSLFG